MRHYTAASKVQTVAASAKHGCGFLVALTTEKTAIVPDDARRPSTGRLSSNGGDAADVKNLVRISARGSSGVMHRLPHDVEKRPSRPQSNPALVRRWLIVFARLPF